MEKAILIQCSDTKNSVDEDEEKLNELKLLARSAHTQIIDSIIIKIKKINPATYLTKGKVELIKEKVKELQPDVIIFNNELKPIQVRNLSDTYNCKVISRTELILDIFALRAKTREAKIQVELAQLKYLLPRLTGYGVMMSRLGGGIGTRGPGEKKIEYDRRNIMRRISILNKKLKNIEKHRELIVKNRKYKTVGIVGYTNAGKSTLLNALSNEKLLTENRLFVTLDSTTRKIFLDNNKFILLSDTVGFIRDIPHNLIASFKSTLSEAKNADLLLHVVDINDKYYQEKIDVVNEVLSELNIDISKSIYVFNKIDKGGTENRIKRINEIYPGSIFISAKNKINLEKLKETIILRLGI